MSNKTDLDWLARNVHVWPEGKLEVLVCWPRNVDTLIWSSVSSDAGWITKGQWLARRAELQNKPSWDEVPSEAQYITQNSNGVWGCWNDKPSPVKEKDVSGDMVEYWGGNKPLFSFNRANKRIGEVLGDWRDTLERRPADLSGDGVSDDTAAIQRMLSADVRKSEPKIDTSAERVQKAAESMHVNARNNDWFERGDLPPVGVECEIFGKDASPEKCKIIAYHKDQVAVQWESFGGGILDVLYLRGDYWKFRPIRTERDVLLSVIVEEMNHYDTDGKLADAILAAGFSLGAK